MVTFLGLGVLLVLVFGLLTALARAHELYCVSVRSGRALVVRGGLPADVHSEVERLLAGAPDDVVIRGFEREGQINVEVAGASGPDAGRLQALLGNLGSQDLSPRLPRDRNLRTFLGFVWLSWWLEARDRDDPPEDPPDRPQVPPSNITPFRR